MLLRARQVAAAIDPGKALLIVELAGAGLLQARIAPSVGVSKTTVSRVLARAGLSKLTDLQPPSRCSATSTRRLATCCTSTPRSSAASSGPATASRATGATGRRRRLGDAVRGHRRPRRIAFTAMHPDEKKQQAVQFLRDAVAYYARLGVTIKRLLTDNGSAFRSRTSPGLRGAGHQAQVHPGLPAADQRQGRTLHPVRAARVGLWLDLPELRTAHQALSSWQHHYNWHRPHRVSEALLPCPDFPPRNNLLTVHN